MHALPPRQQIESTSDVGGIIVFFNDVAMCAKQKNMSQTRTHLMKTDVSAAHLGRPSDYVTKPLLPVVS